MSARLFIGNLPYDATEAELKDFFAPVGPLTFVHLPTDRETGRPRGFAFIEFSDSTQSEEAIRKFNNAMFRGRPLAINEARARESSPGGGGPRRSGYSSSSPSPSGRPDWTPSPYALEPPPEKDRTRRDFGPDAQPRRARKEKSRGGQKSERTLKAPPKERRKKQFYGDVDEDDE